MQAFVQDGIFWHLLTFCAGVGGSLLIIGSAAGVVAMGLEKIEFGWYLRKITLLALAGYFAACWLFSSNICCWAKEHNNKKKGCLTSFRQPFFYLYCLFESFSEYAILKGLKNLLDSLFYFFLPLLPGQDSASATLDMNFSRSTT